MRTRPVMPVEIIACVVVAASALGACGDEAATAGDTTGPDVGKGDRGDEIPADWRARVATTWLHVDVGALSAEASIWFEPGPSRTVSLEAAGLEVQDVYSDAGAVRWQQRDGALHVVHSPGAGPLHVDYTFARAAQGEGYAKNGSTVLWPYYCGNVFPCHSDPSDGMRFELEVSGQARGAKAIYAPALAADAPAYTLAFAIGSYTCQALGTTDAGTNVSVCYLRNGKTKALAGTRSLVAAFDWLERTLGRYTFGRDVASVAVAWGTSAAGGMEHHPYWHVATSEMDLPITHVHEAVHGWYGTGVRIACWEDFVLSEGTTSYLAARALGAVAGPAVERAIWRDYEDELLAALADEDIIAWPATCGAMDILKDGLFSNIVYMKGAFFWRAVADEVGPEVLDMVLARFYERHVGTAARMSDLLDALEEDTGFDPTPLAAHWLLSKGDPFER